MAPSMDRSTEYVVIMQMQRQTDGQGAALIPDKLQTCSAAWLVTGLMDRFRGYVGKKVDGD